MTKGALDVLEPFQIHVTAVCRTTVGGRPVAGRADATRPGAPSLRGRTRHGGTGHRSQRRREECPLEAIHARTVRSRMAAGVPSPDPPAGRGNAEVTGQQTGRGSPPRQGSPVRTDSGESASGGGNAAGHSRRGAPVERRRL